MKPSLKKQHMSEWKTIEIVSKGVVYQLSPQGELLRDNRPPRHKRRTFTFYDYGQFYPFLYNCKLSPMQKLKAPMIFSLLSSQSHKDSTSTTNTNSNLERKKNSQKDSISTSDSHLNLEQNLNSQEDSKSPTDNNININLNGDQNSEETLGAELEPGFSMNSPLPSFNRSSASLQDDIFSIGIDSYPLNESNNFINIDYELDPFSFNL